MSLLIDNAPKSVNIDGAEVEINSDFRTAILFEQMMFDEDFPEHLKIANALQLFYSVLPTNLNEAVDKLIWFYSCGKDRKESGSKQSENSRCYDFEYDDGYIYAAFMQQYGIDLESIEYLHWWKFNALFKSLTNDCEIVKIMDYRTMKISSKMSASERQFYSKMKRLHALPKSQSENEKISEIEKMLMKK